MQVQVAFESIDKCFTAIQITEYGSAFQILRNCQECRWETLECSWNTGRRCLGLPVRPTALEFVEFVLLFFKYQRSCQWSCMSFHELRICLVFHCGLHQITVQEISSALLFHYGSIVGGKSSSAVMIPLLPISIDIDSIIFKISRYRSISISSVSG